MADILGRFSSLIASPLHRRTEREAAEREPLSEAEMLAERLSEWASREACTQTFLPYLRAAIDDEDRRLGPHIVGSHAEGAYVVGYRDALRHICRQFEHWAGESREGE